MHIPRLLAPIFVAVPMIVPNSHAQYFMSINVTVMAF